MALAVELQSVSKSFGSFKAVDALSLGVPEGSVYGFIGPNGSGKTTTLRMITRIYAPDEGKVIVLGSADHAANDDRVGYLPEERGIYEQMKVADLLGFYAKLKGQRPTRQVMEDWLERIELPGVLARKVQTLSKGQKQKIQFLATVIARPQLLLLDEPFSGLDPVNARVVRDLVNELKREGATLIFSTHDMRVAEELCDFVFMIYKGRKVLDGTLAQIRASEGRDVLRVRMTDGRRIDPNRLPGVIESGMHGALCELRLAPEADPQRVLTTLMTDGPVEHFEISTPSLQDIFVRIAAPEQEAIATMG